MEGLRDYEDEPITIDEACDWLDDMLEFNGPIDDCDEE